MDTKYASARNIIGFILLVGWFTFAMGFLGIAMVLTDQSQLGEFGLGISIAIAVGGLTQVALGQVSVAILDMADNSRRMLILQREMAIKAGVELPASDSKDPLSRPDGQAVDEQGAIRVYMGERIAKQDNQYIWNGQTYATLGKAKNAVKTAKS